MFVSTAGGADELIICSISHNDDDGSTFSFQHFDLIYY